MSIWCFDGPVAAAAIWPKHCVPRGRGVLVRQPALVWFSSLGFGISGFGFGLSNSPGNQSGGYGGTSTLCPEDAAFSFVSSPWPGFGFRVLIFLNLEFRVSGFKFRLSSFRFRVKRRIWRHKHCVPRGRSVLLRQPALLGGMSS